MSKLIYFMPTSLDGFIAGENDNLDWAVPILYASYIVLVATGVYLFSVVTFHKTGVPASRRPSPPPVVEAPRPQTV